MCVAKLRKRSANSASGRILIDIGAEHRDGDWNGTEFDAIQRELAAHGAAKVVVPARKHFHIRRSDDEANLINHQRCSERRDETIVTRTNRSSTLGQIEIST